MCFRLIDAKRAQHPVCLLCSVLGVSRAGYYAWKDRPACARRLRDDELLGEIRAIHAESKGTYGWPRIHAELRHRGVRVSRKRVARLMRQAGLAGVIRRRRGKTTIRVPGVMPAPDLARRDFQPAALNQLWVADLTEVSTWEGKLYLAVVIDCFSRRCVGWAMARRRARRPCGRSPRDGRLAAQARPRPGASQRQGRAIYGADRRPALPPGR